MRMRRKAGMRMMRTAEFKFNSMLNTSLKSAVQQIDIKGGGLLFVGGSDSDCCERAKNCKLLADARKGYCDEKCTKIRYSFDTELLNLGPVQGTDEEGGTSCILSTTFLF